MGDIGLLRRRPRGWTAGHAYPRERRTTDRGGGGDDGESVIDTYSLLMDATWDVHVPGWAPYEVREVQRVVPLWVRESAPIGGSGKRFWSLRLRATGGLLREVGVPCLVDPRDPTELWLDWDASYDLHVPAWDRALAVERAVEERKGGLDALAGKVFSPFRPKLAPGDEHLVDEALAEEERRTVAQAREGAMMVRAQNMGWRPPSPEEHHQLLAHVRAAIHLQDVGRVVPATVVAIAPSGRQVCRTPVYEVHLDVDDGGGPRRVVHHEPMNDAWAGRMAAGTTTTVHVDPADPGRLALEAPGPAADEAGGHPTLTSYVDRHERITRTGRRADAVIVSAGPTGGTLHGLPEWAVVLDVEEDGAVRRVVHHEPMGRSRSPWKVGRRTSVRIDPDDPDELTFG